MERRMRTLELFDHPPIYLVKRQGLTGVHAMPDGTVSVPRYKNAGVTDISSRSMEKVMAAQQCSMPGIMAEQARDY